MTSMRLAGADRIASCGCGRRAHRTPAWPTIQRRERLGDAVEPPILGTPTGCPKAAYNASDGPQPNNRGALRPLVAWLLQGRPSATVAIASPAHVMTSRLPDTPSAPAVLAERAPRIARRGCPVPSTRHRWIVLVVELLNTTSRPAQLRESATAARPGEPVPPRSLLNPAADRQGDRSLECSDTSTDPRAVPCIDQDVHAWVNYPRLPVASGSSPARSWRGNCVPPRRPRGAERLSLFIGSSCAVAARPASWSPSVMNEGRAWLLGIAEFVDGLGLLELAGLHPS